MKTSKLLLVLIFLTGCAALTAEPTVAALQAGWEKPARTYRPHTRWWWPGNALTHTDITFQLEQMAAQGLGGVEIMSAFTMYEKGNAEFISPAHLELLKFAVAEARRLDLEVALTFGPGWSFGGPWVQSEDQSKVLAMGHQDLAGGTHFEGAVPVPQLKRRRETNPTDTGIIVAVVAAKINGPDKLDGNSLIVLTDKVQAGTQTLSWDVPPGQWRLMAFRLFRTGQQNQAYSGPRPSMVIDHLSQSAMQRYCDHLGGVFAQAVGHEFGRTVDSFFCDSFEIASLPDTLLWSTDTLAGFTQSRGYDLAPYLPAIWFDIGAATPRVRYDLGKYLSDLGMQTMFKTFNDWCVAHQVQARIQPHYRFTTELIQASGAIDRPETEFTTTRFEPIPDPRKATASGARLYGNGILSAESYTFIHPGRYRTSLQDMKIATDAFLRDGVTQFYNHGYFGSPEQHVAPSRDIPWASRISHWNTWWPYYQHLTQYITRSSYLLRQGKLVADVLVYAPQATAWSERALWGSTRRILPYGDLAKTIAANGYDFDLVNDDLLQNRARFHDGTAEINGYSYRVLVLPRATVLPIETARALQKFVQAGGTLIALDELPAVSAGLVHAASNDLELKKIITELFNDQSRTVFLPEYKMSTQPLDPGHQPPAAPTPPLSDVQQKLLAAIHRAIPPDFSLAGRAQSDGLTYVHKRLDNVDVYFVTNLASAPVATDVTFRVTGKTPQRWNPRTGTTGEAVAGYRSDAQGTTLPVNLEAWESTFFVFTPGFTPATPAKAVATLPSPLPITGEWKMKLAGHGFDAFETNVAQLTSWTDQPRTRHFSGTGRYEIEFDLPADRLAADARLMLDLGAVGDIADVQLNGQPVGVAWMSPYRLDISRAARAGKNQLVVLVTNQLTNYVTGLKAPPDVPVELQARLGQANPELYHFSDRAKIDMAETNLPPSGLLGPVRITSQPR